MKKTIQGKRHVGLINEVSNNCEKVELVEKLKKEDLSSRVVQKIFDLLSGKSRNQVWLAQKPVYVIKEILNDERLINIARYRGYSLEKAVKA